MIFLISLILILQISIEEICSRALFWEASLFIGLTDLLIFVLVVVCVFRRVMNRENSATLASAAKLLRDRVSYNSWISLCYMMKGK